MIINKTELMPFVKFAQVFLHLYVNETTEKKKIKGTFKDLKTEDICKGDDFEAVVCGTVEETYKAYLKWNNHVKEDYEGDREYIHAEWDEEKLSPSQKG